MREGGGGEVMITISELQNYAGFFRAKYNQQQYGNLSAYICNIKRQGLKVRLVSSMAIVNDKKG